MPKVLRGLDGLLSGPQDFSPARCDVSIFLPLLGERS